MFDYDDYDDYADYLDTEERKEAEEYFAQYEGNPEAMDGDAESALASCGWGTDEDYGDYDQYDE